MLQYVSQKKHPWDQNGKDPATSIMDQKRRRLSDVRAFDQFLGKLYTATSVTRNGG